MGSHVWVQQCSYCGFEQMIICSYDTTYFKASCPACGYARWIEERIPDDRDIELAKRALRQMDAEQIQKVRDIYWEDRMPLVARLKGTASK